MLCNVSLNTRIACFLVRFSGMTSLLAKVNKSPGVHFLALFLNFPNFWCLNIQIDLLILKTYYGQFALTTKKNHCISSLNLSQCIPCFVCVNCVICRSELRVCRCGFFSNRRAVISMGNSSAKCPIDWRSCSSRRITCKWWKFFPANTYSQFFPQQIGLSLTLMGH